MFSHIRFIVIIIIIIITIIVKLAKQTYAKIIIKIVDLQSEAANHEPFNQDLHCLPSLWYSLKERFFWTKNADVKSLSTYFYRFKD